MAYDAPRSGGDDLGRQDGFNWTQDREDEITRLYREEGWSGARIAAHLGCGVTRGAVMGKLSRLKVMLDPESARARQALGAAIAAHNSAEVRRELADGKQARRCAERAAQAAEKQARDASRAAHTLSAISRGKPFIQFGERLGGEPAHCAGECKWPLNEPRLGWAEETRFCCEAVEKDGAPYCPYHALVSTNDQAAAKYRRNQRPSTAEAA